MIYLYFVVYFGLDMLIIIIKVYVGVVDGFHIHLYIIQSRFYDIHHIERITLD